MKRSSLLLAPAFFLAVFFTDFSRKPDTRNHSNASFPVFENQLQNAPEFSAPFAKKKSKIQIALLLDTSNSMDGLIEQAKSQLWKMVNELAVSKKGGESPDIEIALYEYGNDQLSANKGYVRQVVPMTNDLDEVSDQLFKLTTNGGSEYCAWVIKDAVTDLQWTNETDDLRMIVISGNEPFDQGPVDPKDAIKAAVQKNICVTTIFCGGWQEGVSTGWKGSSVEVCGKYLNIDQDDKVAHIPTPYDDQIIALNTQLNGTYIAFGRQAEEKVASQSLQDSNAASFGAANARERAAFKAKKQYSNASWDLVDAKEDGTVDLDKIEKDELPAEMQNMNKQEREAYVAKKSAERETIRKQILDLESKVNAFVAEKQKEMAATNTLDNVMREAVRAIATDKGFEF